MFKKIFAILFSVMLMFSSSAFAASTANCFDTDTKLMLHFDGTDEGTTFTDSSSSGRTATVGGDSNTETSSFKFGTASGEFDGTGDYITFPDSADFALTADATIDFWINFTVEPTEGMIIGQHVSSNDRWYIEYCNAATCGNDLWAFIVVNGGVTTVNKTGTGTWTTGTWYHVAFSISGDTYSLYVDGVQVFSASDTDHPVDIAAALQINGRQFDTSLYFNGFLDELRVIKGVAIYTGAFTPKACAYTDCGVSDGSCTDPRRKCISVN